MINDWGRSKEFVDHRAVEEVVSNKVLTDERTLKSTAVLIEMIVELRHGQSHQPGSGPSGYDLVIWSLTDLQTVSGYGATKLFEQIQPGSLLTISSTPNMRASGASCPSRTGEVGRAARRDRDAGAEYAGRGHG